MSTNNDLKKQDAKALAGAKHSENWLLARLDEGGKNGLSTTELLGLAEDDSSKEKLPPTTRATLERLQERGLVTEWAKRWYRISRTDWSLGRIGRGLDEGIVEVRALDPLEASSFVRQVNLKSADRGDLVLLKSLARAGRSAAKKTGQSSERLEVSVVKVLARSISTIVGTVRKNEERAQFLPFQGKRDLVVSWDDPLLDKAEPGVFFTAKPAKVSKRKTSGRTRDSRSRSPQVDWEPVELVELLGHETEPGVDVDVVLRHYNIRDTFPAEVLSEAEAFPDAPDTKMAAAGPKLKGGVRVDLRGLTTITIDGATARDFDDAISIEARPKGHLRLGVHVADVAEYVTEGSALNVEAELRGTSVYLPDRVVPMLPEKLSNGLCSLNPQVPRFAMSVFMEFDRGGQVVTTELSETLIESDARLIYEPVSEWLDAWQAGKKPKTGVGKKVEKTLQLADDLVQRLLRKRVERGGLDFDLPMSRVEVDAGGQPVAIVPEKRLRAHRLIEEFMVAANQAVARYLEERDIGAMFRRHDPPALSRIKELSLQLEGLGLTVDAAAMEELFQAVGESPVPLRELQKTVQGLPEEEFVSSLILMSLQRAIYHPKNAGHYALGIEHYCHFTSPIRRYPDLIVHRQLKRVLRGEAPVVWSRDRHYSMADHCSATEQGAERAERELSQWKKVRWLSKRVGEKFTGRITGVQPFGVFVQLDEVLVDGLLPINNLTDDYYVFERERMLLEGSDKGRILRLSDRIEVTLEGINEERRGIILGLAELGGDSPKGDRSKRRSSKGRNSTGRSAREPERGRASPKRRRPARRTRMR